MELSEKIQKIRKEQGLTQEQFANQLFVSRTAVSKWETGRGTPSIESFKLISNLYGISLDELLQPEEAIAVAENQNKENLNRFAYCIDGIFNIAALLGLLLPLYKVELNHTFYSVPLYQFKGWLAVFYWALPMLMTIFGISQIIINNRDCQTLKKAISGIGLFLNVCSVLLLILSAQPYPAVMFFVLLLLKNSVRLIKIK